MNWDLDQKQRLYLAGGIALACLLVVVSLAFAYRASLARLDRTIASRQAQLQETRRLLNDYLSLKQQAGVFQQELAASSTMPSLTFLEDAVARTAGREKLALMRPLPTSEQGGLRIETTEFKLERVDMTEAMRVLWEIDRARPPMRIDKLFLKQRFDSTALLDMSATVSTARSR